MHLRPNITRLVNINIFFSKRYVLHTQALGCFPGSPGKSSGKSVGSFQGRVCVKASSRNSENTSGKFRKVFRQV